MKNLIFLFCLSLIYCCEKSNEGKEPVKNAESPRDEVEIKIKECKCKDSAIVQMAGQFFPFNKTSKIVVFEFNERVVVHKNKSYKNLIEDGKFQRKDITKEVVLTDLQKAELEKIFFNKVEHCNDGNLDVDADCMYQPHHCIVFYDNKGVPFSFFEICLLCEYHMTDPQWNFGPVCGNFYCQIRELFKKSGLNQKMLELDACPGWKFD